MKSLISPTLIVLHHSATPEESTVEDIKNVHLQRGFLDIGYHWLISRDGSIFQGRNESFEGAHCKGLNARSIGVCCIGNYEVKKPSEALIDSLVVCLTEVLLRYHLNPDAIILHHEAKNLSADATQTQCPGSYLRGLFSEIKSRVQALFSKTENVFWTQNHRLSSKNLDYSSEIALSKVGWNGNSLVGYGIVKNTGLTPWINTSSDSPHAFCIGIVALSLDGERTIIESRANFDHLTVAPLTGITTFSFEIKNFRGLSNLPLILLFDVLKETSFWFSDKGSKPIFKLFDTGKALQGKGEETTTPVHEKIEVILEQKEIRHDSLLILKGKAKNISTIPLFDSNDETSDPFRIGAECFIDEKRVYEARSRISGGKLLPEMETKFSFLLPLSRYEPGTILKVRIEGVKERKYWLRDIGSPGIETEVVVPQRTKQEDEIRSRTFSSYSQSENTKVSILVISPTLPLFDRETGGKRLYLILKTLSEADFEIAFLYENGGNVKSPQKYISALKDLGIKASENPLDFLSSYNGKPFHVALLCWHTTGSAYTNLVRGLFPECKIIVDSVDIHWLREQRGVLVGEVKYTDEELKERKENEKLSYLLADETWVVSEEDKDALLKETGDIRARIVPALSEPTIGEWREKNRKGVIYVGGFRHPPNIEAAKRAHALMEAFRSKTGSKAPLYIVGSEPPAEVTSLHDGEKTFVTGYVPDLTPWYEKARVMLAPITYGAGVKGKICDAICFGVPVITTPIGNEGIGLIQEKEAFIVNKEEEYITALKKVFSNAFDLERMRDLALRRVLTHNGLKESQATIKKAFSYGPVSALIVSWNRIDLLKRSIMSLNENTDYPSLSISVLLNGCKDGSYEFIEEFKNKSKFPINSFWRDSNDYFLRPMNYLLRTCPEKDVVLVNNDIEFRDKNWLLELYDAAYSSSRIGAAGGLLLDEEGKVSEAGGYILQSGEGINFGRGLTKEDSEINHSRYVGFSSGALLFIKRSTLSKLGAFNEDFYPMYFEDVEFQYRMHQHGLKTIYTPRCIATHNEGSSAGKDTNIGAKRFQVENREKFLKLYDPKTLEKLGEI